MKRVFMTEGILPFWRGNLANVLRYFPTQALNFAFKDSIKAAFKTSKDAPASLKFATHIASGGAAGTMSLLFVYSLDYARTRLANDSKGKGGERQFNGLVDVYVKTLKSDGIQGLYRGFTISAVGIFIYHGMYFGMFDTLKPMLIGGKDASVAASFLLGWAVTVGAGLMSYPIDTVRRRMMMTSGGGVKYKGSVDCFRQVVANEGFMSLMKGAGANILRGVAGAGVLSGFDKSQGSLPGQGSRVQRSRPLHQDHRPARRCQGSLPGILCVHPGNHRVQGFLLRILRHNHGCSP